MSNEIAGFGDHAVASMQANVMGHDSLGIEGFYRVECRDESGNLKWEETAPNLVVAVGKQLMLDTLLKGAAYSVVGPFLGLCSTTFTASAADTMTAKGWTEFVNYTVSGSAVRGTAVFAVSTSSGTTPSNVTTSAAAGITYTITGAGGTVYGCFLVTGPGAVNTQSSTTGTLYSEVLFGTSKAVTAGDTVTVTYSTTATS